MVQRMIDGAKGKGGPQAKQWADDPAAYGVVGLFHPRVFQRRQSCPNNVGRRGRARASRFRYPQRQQNKKKRIKNV